MTESKLSRYARASPVVFVEQLVRCDEQVICIERALCLLERAMALEMLCRKVECRPQKLVRARRLCLGRGLEQGISAFGEDTVIRCGEIASTR